MQADPRYAQFEAEAQAHGYPEVVVRNWQPGQVVAEHSHPFDAWAMVVEGEMWLTVNGETRRLGPGDRFEVPRGQPHAERYGADGATYWVGRRTP